MMTPKITSFISPKLMLLALVASSTLLFACEKDPKPRELSELEVMWQDPETRKVKDIPGAGGYYRDAYQFRLRAEESYNDGDNEQAREYAIWSLLKYRSAQAVAQQFEAKERLDASNAKMVKLNPELAAINQERNKLVAEVGGLERDLAVAKRLKDDQARRLNAMQNANTGDDGAALEAQHARAADQKIQVVEQARQRAIDVNAPKHAGATYNRAENVLKSLRVMRQNTPIPYETIIDAADVAIKAYDQSAKESQPGYKEQVEKSDPIARRQGLQREASAILGTPYALTEGDAVRIIASRAFLPGAASPNDNGARTLKAIIELAKKYDEFTITIEAYTSKGNATENLTTSQLRARRVEELFVSNGVDKKRVVSSKGQGQDKLRFPDDTSMNERVEIIFRTP